MLMSQIGDAPSNMSQSYGRARWGVVRNARSAIYPPHSTNAGLMERPSGYVVSGYAMALSVMYPVGGDPLSSTIPGRRYRSHQQFVHHTPATCSTSVPITRLCAYGSGQCTHPIIEPCSTIPIRGYIKKQTQAPLYMWHSSRLCMTTIPVVNVKFHMDA